MEFDSGVEIAEKIDSDGELMIKDGEDYSDIYLNITELNYIINNAPKMIEDYHQKKFEEMEVNPDLCNGCIQFKETLEEDGVEYTCRGSIEDCGRM
jgi:hypothetical protein